MGSIQFKCKCIKIRILFQKIVQPIVRFYIITMTHAIKVEHEGFKRRNPFPKPTPHATFSIVLYGQVVVVCMCALVCMHVVYVDHPQLKNLCCSLENCLAKYRPRNNWERRIVRHIHTCMHESFVFHFNSFRVIILVNGRKHQLRHGRQGF